MVEELRRQAARSALNDWGFIRLAWETGRTVTRGDRSSLPLFTWFVLLQSGKDARIAYNRDGLHLIVSIKENVYGRQYFRLDGKRYYVVNFDKLPERIGSVRTYSGQHSDVSSDVSMAMSRVPRLESGGFEERVLRFEHARERIEVPVRLRKPRVDYFFDYPQTDLKVYFNTPLPPELLQDMKSGLAPHLEGLSQLEAVNRVLRFVQTAFDYKVDEDQFGREKHLIPEELAWYPYSDCEDRSFLFARLAKELLGLEVIGLYYPGHVATAVKLDRPVSGGDVIRFEGSEYTIADPTYILSDAGMEMPRFRQMEKRVIRIDS